MLASEPLGQGGLRTGSEGAFWLLFKRSIPLGNKAHVSAEE